MADRIELRGLRVVGTHGAHAEEQHRPQPFEIDIDLEADLTQAAVSDAIDDTVDYGALAQAVARVVSVESFSLLERLAERIAEVALGDQRARTVTVTVRKVRPPVPVDLATAGVCIVRSNPAAGG